MDIAKHAKIPYTTYSEPYNKIPDAKKVAEILKKDPSITHVSMIHSETTSGLLNDIEAVGKVVKESGRTFIVDANRQKCVRRKSQEVYVYHCISNNRIKKGVCPGGCIYPVISSTKNKPVVTFLLDIFRGHPCL